MGAGHAGTGDGAGSGGTTNPGAQDVGAGGKDIDDGTIVGEGGAGIVASGGTDSADRGLGSGGVVGSVGVVIASGNSKEDTGVDEVPGSSVDGGRVATAEGHVGNSAVGAVAAGEVGLDIVDTSNDTGSGAGAGGVEDLDSNQGGLLGDTIEATANGASDVGAVAVSVGVGAVDVVAAPDGTTLEVRVGGVDTSVDNVRASTGTGAIVVAVGGATRSAAGDASKTPGSTSLRDNGVDGELGLLLDVLNLGEVADGLEGSIVKSTSEALELATLVDLVGLVLAEDLIHDGIGGTILELDNVLAGNDLASAGRDDRGALVKGTGSSRGSESRGQESQESSSREEHFVRVGPGRTGEVR